MALTYKSRVNEYQNSRKTNRVKLDTFEAWSYDHWKYATTYQGITIYNNYYWSSTTCKHQNDFKELVECKYEVTLRLTRLSLDNPIEAIQDEIERLRGENRELLEAIAKPRTQKKKNLERGETITKNAIQISRLKDLLIMENVKMQPCRFDSAFTKLDNVLLGVG